LPKFSTKFHYTTIKGERVKSKGKKLTAKKFSNYSVFQSRVASHESKAFKINPKAITFFFLLKEETKRRIITAMPDPQPVRVTSSEF
jgi:hypothetical protein